MLKRNYKLLAIAVLSIWLFVSCNKDDESGSYADSVVFHGSSILNWDSEGKFLIITERGPWSITFSYPEGVAPGWCTANSLSGTGSKNVWLATAANNMPDSREVKIIVQTERRNIELTLTQYGSAGLPSDLKDRLELPGIDNYEWFLDYTKGMFALEYDITKKHSKWVAWRLHKGDLGSGRTDAWQFDPRIPSQYSPVRSDFSGYDRGHLCPSADRNKNTTMNAETFMYSNMSPQVGAFNQGIWATLEMKIRGWVGGGDTLYVCTGGTILKESDIERYTSPSRMAVPKYYFKVVLRKKINSSNYDAIGFWFENRRYTEGLSVTHAKTVDQIEALTGLDFFCNLPDDIETRVESGFNPSAWGL